MEPLRLALAQMRPVAAAAARARLAAAAGAAGAAGAHLLVLPEMALTGYDIGPLEALAEPEDGPRERMLGEAARRHGIAILAGLPRREGPSVSNLALLVGPDGAPLGACAKTHLFGDDRARFAAGAGFAPLVAFRGWRLGIAICYDIEFPETARALALAGADAILVPTANMTPFESVATRLVPARAQENAVFVAYANFTGAEGRHDYAGLSCIVGPDGADLARAGREETLLLADLDPAALAAARAGGQLGGRRPEIYGALAEGALTRS